MRLMANPQPFNTTPRTRTPLQTDKMVIPLGVTVGYPKPSTLNPGPGREETRYGSIWRRKRGWLYNADDGIDSSLTNRGANPCRDRSLARLVTLPRFGKVQKPWCEKLVNGSTWNWIKWRWKWDKMKMKHIFRVKCWINFETQPTKETRRTLGWCFFLDNDMKFLNCFTWYPKQPFF